MKRKLFYLTIIIFILLIFINYNIVLNSTIDAVNIWLYKVFPYLFIMIIINDLLITSDFSSNFNNINVYIFIMSLLSGSPTSAYIINNLYKEKKISKNNANLALTFTYFCNPLFLYSILNLIFNNIQITIKLMIIHYISNIIIYIINRKKIKKEFIVKNTINLNLSNSIKKSINTVTMVLGSIVFFMIISEIITNTFYIQNIFRILFKGTLEITQGLNLLINCNLNIKIKEIIAIAFISFGGLSIHTQIKCILNESDLSYNYFLDGRIIQTLIGISLTLIT